MQLPATVVNVCYNTALKTFFCYGEWKFHVLNKPPTIFIIEVEVQSQSSNRLTALHSSLQQEAEKIRKWKNATELELKHKVQLNHLQNF